MEIKEYNEFQNISDSWNNFLSKSPDNNVFSTWEWLSTWWNHFGKGKKLVILVIEDKDEILGIAPLVYSKYNFFKFGKLRKISFVGDPQSDYNTFIFNSSGKKSASELVINYLNDHTNWDYIELRDIPERSVSVDLLHKINQGEKYGNWVERMCSSCPYIPLPNSMDALMKQIKINFRHNLRRQLKNLEKEYRVELKRYDEIGTLKEAMNLFFQLHQKRWKLKNKPGAFSESAIRNFHIDIAKRFDEKGWLGLYFLTINDEPISARYGFEYNQKFHGYLSGFEPEYIRYGVSNVTRLLVIERCIEKGLMEYDMMRGGWSDGTELYKKNWTCTERKNIEFLCVDKAFFPQIYFNLYNCFHTFYENNNTFKKLSVRLGLSAQRFLIQTPL